MGIGVKMGKEEERKREDEDERNGRTAIVSRLLLFSVMW